MGPKYLARLTIRASNVTVLFCGLDNCTAGQTGRSDRGGMVGCQQRGVFREDEQIIRRLQLQSADGLSIVDDTVYSTGYTFTKSNVTAIFGLNGGSRGNKGANVIDDPGNAWRTSSRLRSSAGSSRTLSTF